MTRALARMACLVVLAGASPARGALRDPNFAETEFATTQDDMDTTSLAWAPDGTGRLFVTGKEGAIRVIENGVVRPEPFAVVAPLYTGSECGLLGLAFDPDFVNTRYVYVFATVSATEQRILRYRDSDSVGTEETTILENLPTLGRNHDGGALGFGPDGKLYWAIGDLGDGTGVGADLVSFAAKIGRANRDGSAPGDNPFDDGPGPNNDFVWARGFRNPFSLTFQGSTGRLWLNVVGANFEQSFAVEAGDNGGWNMHEARQPDGFVKAQVSYQTNVVDTHPVVANGAVRTSGIATFTLSEGHTYLPGSEVTIAGVADSSFDTTGYVTNVLSETAFTLDQAGPAATSGGGTATATNLGGCITGGVFYDSTAGSAEYRGNFFFGDYNVGRIMRARVTDRGVSAVQIWGEGHDGMVDMDVGEDGDLYYVSHHGSGLVYRARFRPTAQGLVVSRAHLGMLEGGAAVFHVRLSLAPTSAVSVAVLRRSGDADIAVSAGRSLAFDANDWSVPKLVRLTAGRDADASDDFADLSVSSSGLPTETVSVRVTDEWQMDPGEGGNGGESQGGSAGDAAGQAGEPATGGAGGEPSTGGADGRGGGAGDAGGAAAGEGGAEGGAGSGSKGSAESGCGCATQRATGGSSGLLVGLAWLLRRRLRMWQSGSRQRA